MNLKTNTEITQIKKQREIRQNVFYIYSRDINIDKKIPMLCVLLFILYASVSASINIQPLCVEHKTRYLDAECCDHFSNNVTVCKPHTSWNSATKLCERVCTNGWIECDDECVNPTNNRNYCGNCETSCVTGFVCSGGSCVISCHDGQVANYDGTRCLDKQVLADHCLAAGGHATADANGDGWKCDDGFACIIGECTLVCTDDETPNTAGNKCLDFATDANNCGSEGTVCDPGHRCSNSTCDIHCQDSLTACGVGCYDTTNNRLHCGECDNVCDTGKRCVESNCAVTCDVDLLDCDGCINPLTDALHCGECDNACPLGIECTNGACLEVCASGLTMCDNKCVDVLTDASNCNACGTAVGKAQQCVGGNAVSNCAGGRIISNDADWCFNNLTDCNNCGTEGTICPAYHTCVTGVCTLVCEEGYTDCDGKCKDLSGDDAHCGACDQAVGAHQHCADSAPACDAGWVLCGDVEITAITGCPHQLTNHIEAEYDTDTFTYTCVCAATYGDCNTDWVDGCEIQITGSGANNAEFCGSCTGATIGDTDHASCIDGVPTCGANWDACDGSIVDADGCEIPLLTDTNYCGDCVDSAIGDTTHATCTTGERVCVGLWDNCNTDWTDGCERDLNTATDCGVCNQAIGNTEHASCVEGTRICATDYKNCDTDWGNGCEMQVTGTGATTVAHCGDCDAACNDNEICHNGVCECDNTTGYFDCDADMGTICNHVNGTGANEAAHCGVCYQAIGNIDHASCIHGVRTCAATYADCTGGWSDGCEVQITGSGANTVLHCGACDQGIGDTEHADCVDGVRTCDSSWGNCDVDWATGCNTDLLTTAVYCSDCIASACDTGEICDGGVCECDNTNGYYNCAGDLESTDCIKTNGTEAVDVDNCGACGVVVGPHATCEQGAQGGVPTCVANYEDCDGSIVDANGCEINKLTDASHCNACNAACDTGEICDGGVCECDNTNGYYNCAGDLESTDCIKTNGTEAVDVDNCGACGVVVGPHATCEQGAQGGVPTCVANYEDCDGSIVDANGCEINKLTDASHCNACNAACGTGQICHEGVCECDNTNGYFDCDIGGALTCTRTNGTEAVDATNCGACDVVIGDVTHASCVAGERTCTDNAAIWDDCNNDWTDGCETNKLTDELHCNACNNACGTGQICHEGVCECDNTEGYFDCDIGGALTCTNTNGTDASDSVHCGACGNVCTDSYSVSSECVNGECECMSTYSFCLGECRLTSTYYESLHDHCGDCLTECGDNEICHEGVCECDSTTGYFDCDADMATACNHVNGTGANEAAHCGLCNQAIGNVAHASCVNGTRTCADNYRNCDDDWATGCEQPINLDTHCGGCTTNCNDYLNQHCTGTDSAASCVCDSNYWDCNGEVDGCEIHLYTDESHCGACNEACGDNAHCEGGLCLCSPGFANCDGSWSDGCELDITSNHVIYTNQTGGGDNDECTCVSGYLDCNEDMTSGSDGCEWGTTNVDTDYGSNGGCMGADDVSCIAPYDYCSGDKAAGCITPLNTETDCESCGTTCDFDTDIAHCGTFDTECGATGQICHEGVCECDNTEGYFDCDIGGALTCTNTNGTDASDSVHCGACGNVCTDSYSVSSECVDGECECMSTYSFCLGECRLTSTYYQTLDDHCGSCATPIGDTTHAECASGTMQCDANYGDCNADWTDGCETPLLTTLAHCGACNTPCKPNQECVGGECQCLSDYLGCDGNITDADGCEVSIITDSNCGSCGNICETGETCVDKACICNNAIDYYDCGEASCTDVKATDTDHCGACDVVVGATQATCEDGGFPTCTGDYRNCDGDWSNGCEVDRTTDALNCGVCGTNCTESKGVNSACTASVCGCASGYSWCDNACRLTATWYDDNEDYCGDCVTSCGTGELCSSGSCVCDTGNGYVDCDNNMETACIKITGAGATNASHCGACNQAIGDTTHASCMLGVRMCTDDGAIWNDCNNDWTDGCETNIETDATHCNECNAACDSFEVCNTGTCECDSGYTDCDSACQDDSTYFVSDNLNCGTCGNVCGTGEICVASSCVCNNTAGFSDCDSNMETPCIQITGVGATNSSHCGACTSAVVGPHATCVNGVPTCDTNYDECAGSIVDADGCEISLQDDNDNCGVCDTVCPTNEECVTGLYSCISGYSRCDGTCREDATYYQSLHDDCGTCGVECTATSEICHEGVCECNNTAGYFDCDADMETACIHTNGTGATDVNNCGACGVVVAAVQATCEDGGVPTCTGNYANCDGNWANGCEIDTDTNVLHCGECNAEIGILTHAAAGCVAGTVSCDSLWGDCSGGITDGCETALTTSSNCGECGISVGANAVCHDNGTATCLSPVYGNCANGWVDGCEVTFATDDDNCGACDTQCGDTGTCTGGSCTCIADYGNCDGNWGTSCEVDITTTLAHCGLCTATCEETACTAGICVNNNGSWTSCLSGTTWDVCVNGDQTCSITTNSGVCECPAETTLCDAECKAAADFLTDSDNCAECGAICPASGACTDAVCACDNQACLSGTTWTCCEVTEICSGGGNTGTCITS